MSKRNVAIDCMVLCMKFRNVQKVAVDFVCTLLIQCFWNFGLTLY